MPNVLVLKREIEEKIEKKFSKISIMQAEEEFEQLCFDYGMEFELTDSKEMMNRFDESKEPEPVYKIEVAANRYDLLSLEGLTFALRSFLYKEPQPKISIVNVENPITITVDESTKEVWPVVVAAILRDLNFDQDKYNSFIELQDMLHNNICRWRTLVSMGTHDLDKVEGNISYEAQPPGEISF